VEARHQARPGDIDLDATLLGAHSEKQGAAGNFKGGFGFHPMLAYCDETNEALAGQLRAGNAGANTAADQIQVAEQALAQIPAEHVETIDVLLRVDSAGASHELLDWAREGRIGFSVGYDLTEAVRAAIVALKEESWRPATDQNDTERDNGQVAEATHLLNLSGWPEGSRVIVRRERPHPGAQLSFTDHDGHRFQAILTDQPDHDIACLERRHRARARVEDRIRNDKDTGLANLPFRDFAHNEVWLALVLLAHDLIAWTQTLALTGELQTCEPKRLRYRLLHVAARLAFSGRQAKLRLAPARPGPPTSPPPSPSSKRSQHPPANTSPPPATTTTPTGHPAAITAGRTRQAQRTTHARARRYTPANPHHQRTPPRKQRPTHPATPTARSGLGLRVR